MPTIVQCKDDAHFDMKNPMPANPEQTASIFSSAFFIWIDPLIVAAARTTHLDIEKLPPLADYDATKHLVGRAYPVRIREASCARRTILTR